MSVLDVAAFRTTPLTRQPFEFLVLPGFVKAVALEAIHAGFPHVDRPGSFPLSEVSYGPGFGALVDELNGPEMRGRVRGEVWHRPERPADDDHRPRLL